MRSGLLSFIVLSMVSAALAPALGRPLSPVPAPVRAKAPAAAPAALDPSSGRKLVGAVISHGNPDDFVAKGSGFVQIGNTKTLTCPNGGAKCAIEAVQNMQVQGIAGGSGNYAICTQVDGVDMALPFCPYLGAPGADQLLAGTFTQNAINLAPGAHAIQTFVYSDNGIGVGTFEFTYRLYQ